VTVDALTMWLTFGSCAAGFLGSLTGMGGGVVIVPLLTLGFGVDMRYAIGASLVSVIATSSASAATYVKDVIPTSVSACFSRWGPPLGRSVGLPSRPCCRFR